MPVIGGMPLIVVFTDTSSDDVTAWLWDFGDGTTSAVQNPTHQYSVEGTYTVTLHVTSPNGMFDFSDTVTAVDGTAAVYTAPVPPNLVGGGGVIAGGAAEPQVMLRLSNDGGKTWPVETMRCAGKRGEYLTRVKWDRLGCARRRVFEVSVADPTQWRITGAYLKAKPAGG